MWSEIPKRTPAFDAILLEGSICRRSLILQRVLARVTQTTELYWEQVRQSGNGPRALNMYDAWWYDLAEIDAWLSLFDEDTGGSHAHH